MKGKINQKLIRVEENRIYHCDCLDGMRLMDDGCVDLIVTSPPYYNAKHYIQYDSIDSYMGIMRDIFSECYRIIKPSRMCIINISPVLVPRESRNKQSYRIPLPFYFVPMMEEVGYEFLEDIIWEKPDGSVVNRNGKFSSHRKPVAYKPNVVTEYVLVFKKPAPFLIDRVLRNDSLVGDGYERTNVWKINPCTNGDHPALFPDKLVENCIKYYSYEGDLICDPFMGSGTTARVAKQCKRKYIGFETVEKYYEMSVNSVSEK